MNVRTSSTGTASGAETTKVSARSESGATHWIRAGLNEPVHIAQIVSIFGLVVLFPGFMLFHLSVAAFGLTPPPLVGGLFGVVSAFLALAFFVLIPLIMRTRPVIFEPYTLATLGFILFTLLWALIHVMVINADYVRTAYTQSVETAVLWVALFFSAMFLPRNSPTLRHFFIWSFWVLVCVLVFYVVTTGAVMFNAQRFYGAENVATYQGFARSALVMILVLLAVSTTTMQRLVLFAAGIFTLFVLGARSEFYAFAGTLFVMWSLLMLRDVRYLILTLGGIALVIVTVSLWSDTLMHSRQFQVLDLSTSGSWGTRQWLNELAARQVSGEPLFGRFGGHVAEGGSAGAYAHNALSAWVNYGLLGFLWYLGLSITAFVGSVRGCLRMEQQDSLWVLALAINFAALLLMVVAKPVFWPLAALGWGCYARAKLPYQP